MLFLASLRCHFWCHYDVISDYTSLVPDTHIPPSPLPLTDYSLQLPYSPPPPTPSPPISTDSLSAHTAGSSPVVHQPQPPSPRRGLLLLKLNRKPLGRHDKTALDNKMDAVNRCLQSVYQGCHCSLVAEHLRLVVLLKTSQIRAQAASDPLYFSDQTIMFRTDVRNLWTYGTPAKLGTRNYFLWHAD